MVTAEAQEAALVERTGAKRVGREWRCACPSHEDERPSLDFHAEGDRLLFACRAGCRSSDVLTAFRERFPDVFASNGNGRDPGTEWAIRDTEGEVVAIHVRYRKRDGTKGYAWKLPGGAKGLGGRKAVALPLYRTPEVLAVPETDPVFLTEGEKAADALVRLGLVAAGTVTGAASTPGPDALEVLRGREVALWADNDAEGRRHMDRVEKSLRGVARRLGRGVWPDAPAKGDAADFAAAGGSREGVLGLVRWIDVDAAEGPPSGLVRLGEATSAALAGLDQFARGDFSRCIPTGIPSLDRRLGGGLRKGQVTLVGAATGGGKTTILQAVAMEAARQRGAVLFVSPEMSASELAEREILRRSGTAKWRRSPWRSLQESARASAARAHRASAERLKVEAAPLFVLDRPATDMAAVWEEAEALKRRDGLELVALDYAQELAGDDARTPRYMAVGNVAQRSVALARALDVPVLIASQVNAGREGTRTTYSFRESAILEHKAHTVLIFVVEWRDGAGGHRVVESAAFRATKNRSGPLFELKVQFEPGVFSISDESPTPEARLPYAADRDYDPVEAVRI